jgi:Pyruvate/2-oxoglutarate dehydrogenase complex, dehydrogenase (E1) component, eukaryotic type, alpha subunit
MTEIRLFEKRAYDLFMQNLVKGTTHLGTGQEAVAAGVSQVMRDDDYMFVTYRGHNHVLARGTPMTQVMAELLGRENGLMRGKGGSMHLLDTSRGILGAYAIIGAQLVIANGSAWSALYRGSGRSRSASSATAPPTSAPSTRRSTWPRCGSCRWSSSARTTSTWSTPRSAR